MDPRERAIGGHSGLADLARAEFDELGAALRGIDVVGVEAVGEQLLAAWRRDAQILVVGNGGSASTASHFACDLAKSTVDGGPSELKRAHALALNESVPLMTAWANDHDFGRVFAEQVLTLARPGDLLVVITASGRSKNVLAAIDAARTVEAGAVGLLGFDGGEARSRLDAAVLVPSHDYGIVEDAHLAIAHLLTRWLGEWVRASSTAP